ncbi:unnamed protein product [Allacma fusca]|uniref:Uncharacterized protein n=1 Tax=Allacma fusca TaxID=39272 RepID=A0A8J2KIZ7_9HEXA|nr:unnamed protein product [Allacma fusca]
MFEFGSRIGSQYQTIIITPSIRHCLIKTLKIGELLAGQPFKWNHLEQRAELGSLRRQFFWRINITLALIHVVFVLTRGAQGTMTDGLSASEKIQLKFMSTYYLLAGFLHLSIIQNIHVFPYYVNQCFGVMDKFEKDFVSSSWKSPNAVKAIGVIMQLLLVLLVSMHGFIIIISLMRPYSYEQVSSLLFRNREGMSSSINALPSGVVTVYGVYMYVSSVTTIVIAGFCTLLLNLFLLNELRPSESSVTGAALHQPQNALKVYRHVRLLMNLGNQIYGQLIVPCAKFGEAFAGHPFKWNEVKQRAEIGSPKQQLIWSINVTLALIHVLFVLIRGVQSSVDKALSARDQIQLEFMSTYYLLVAFLHTAIIQNRYIFPYYVNQCFDVIENFEKDFVTSNCKSPKTVKAIGAIMQLLWLLLVALHGFIIIISLMRPYSYEQVSSLLGSKEGMSSSLTALPSGVVTVYAVYMYVSSVTTIVLVGFCTLLLYLFILDELRPSESSVTGDHLRQTQNVLHVYGKIQLLMNLANQIYGQIIVPCAKVLMMSWCVYSTYGAIMMHGVLSLAHGFVAIFSFGYLAVLFTFLAQLQGRSSDVKVYWREHLNSSYDPWFRKSLKSLPDITFKLRGLYFVDRHMVLAMLQAIIENTVTFLLWNR